MLLFDVYVHPVHGHTAVKHGFSWPAFLFGIFWACHKRLWAVVVGYLCVIIALSSSGGTQQTDSGGLSTLYDLLGFGVSLFVGAAGNGWCRLSLERQGYRAVDTVRASSAPEAIELLYGHRQHSGASV